MKGLKIGGSKSSSPLSAAKTEMRRPTTPTPSASKPTAKSPPPKDGFDSRSSTTTRAPTARPPQQPGKDVTSSFSSNPLAYSGQNVLNSYNMAPPQGMTLPKANEPFVPANQSVVTMNVHQNQGNSNLSITAPGGQGTPAYYLHYLSTGAGKYAGIQGVPLHPRPGEPNMVLTGALNGCAVHALHDRNTDTLSFLHHGDYSEKNGQNELKEFLSRHHNLRPAGSFTPNDYARPTGPHGDLTGATPFIHYSQPSSHSPGQWTIAGQLQTYKNGGSPGGRPELMRPQDVKVPWVQTIPVVTKPVELAESP